MRKIAFLIMVITGLLYLTGCSYTSLESKSKNEAEIKLSLEKTEEDTSQTEADFSKGDLVTMFEEVNNEEIENFFYDDYNKDGIHEAFVLTKCEDYYKLWYLNAKECQIVCEKLEGLDNMGTDILTFTTKDYLLLQQVKEEIVSTLVYSIDNNSQVLKVNISDKGYISKGMSGEIFLQINRNEEENKESEKIKTYYLYYMFDEGFKEYGAIPIGTEQFLEFEGAQEILDRIVEQYPDYEIEYSFLYRANHYINVNVALLKEGVTEYKNMTLTYDDSGVTNISDDLAEGKMDIAYMLDIATFPTAFKHPKKDIVK